jgi:hypothetical protein
VYSLNKHSPLALFDNDQGSAGQTIDKRSEIYMVKATIWKAARMGDFDGCLCIGCLEQRIGRRLVPKEP